MKIGAVAILAPALVVLNARPSPYHVDHDYTIAAKSAADVASIEDTHFTNLTKRTPYPPISQVAWELAVNEGCNLLRAIDSRDELAVTFQGRVGSIQSEFLNYPTDLQNWGYRVLGTDLTTFQWAGGPDVYDAYEALGIDARRNDEGGPNVCVAWKHSEQVTVDGTVYRPTTAVFSSIINVDQGVLIGWHKFSPGFYGGLLNPPVTVLPKLRSWGEVVFLDWAQIAARRNKPVSNIKYIISADIVNSDTGAILQRILGVNDVKANCGRYEWDHRVDISMATEAGQALLSSPNGRGAALFLIQHKNYLGHRTTIDKVTMWCGYLDDWEVHLLFSVKTQPDDPQGTGPNDGIEVFDVNANTDTGNSSIRTHRLH